VVATPIGNLRDITLRAMETLTKVDVVAAEDTRHTTQLLSHFGIQAKLTALHEHNERSAGQKLVELLKSGKSVALVSDAGTPCVSDPGAILIALARDADITVVPIPGANAAITALSASGITAPHFLFYGFLPARPAQRRSELDALKALPYTLVFYEAPHRMPDCVADLAAVLGGARSLTLARELTKTFETIHTCPLGEAHAWLKADTNRQRGEFVLLVEGAPPVDEQAIDSETRHTLEVLLGELPLKQAVKLAAEISGAKKNALYELALTLRSSP
jgi:16S rRNA (cytidine1402-2'-O)-methyltransferase